MIANLTKLTEWQALKTHYQQWTDGRHLRDLFAADANRFSDFSLSVGDLLVDYSKNLLTRETVALLCCLAEARGLPAKIEELFTGFPVNGSENRPALHTALRCPQDKALLVSGHDIMPTIHYTLTQMEWFTERVRTGQWLGYDYQPITDVVNLGIGGSELGPLMATTALTPYATNSVRCHFVSNVDSAHIHTVLKSLNPATTLFIISSKSFTTIETLANASTAKQWLLKAANNSAATSRHFVAVTSESAKAMQFGVLPEYIFEIADWVGGRYSIWSAIGLPIALSIGMKAFREFLTGAYSMDKHFQTAPLHTNLPVILGMIGIWYINFFAAQTHAIIPYSYDLRYLPAYLQQADMESNGKRVNQEGQALDYTTGPIIWGGVGTNSQHAYHQLLHQGTQMVPVDFILPVQSSYPYPGHQTLLFANCLAQSEALMRGKTHREAVNDLLAMGYSTQTANQLANHQTTPGNRPSNTLVVDKLTPFNLGAIIALYEHKIFVQGVIWGINSFDQWGVELGKQLTAPILKDIHDEPSVNHHDASTNHLIALYKRIAQVS